LKGNVNSIDTFDLSRASPRQRMQKPEPEEAN